MIDGESDVGDCDEVTCGECTKSISLYQNTSKTCDIDNDGNDDTIRYRFRRNVDVSASLSMQL